eukprot:m.392640 g.392640  ORF g.392640 m.392640 type:complete len:372 (-) comp20087_c1_seq6:24-1139(-)
MADRDEGSAATPHLALDLPYCADAVEWGPPTAAHHNVLACATYELHQASDDGAGDTGGPDGGADCADVEAGHAGQKRKGALILFRSDDPTATGPNQSLQKIRSAQTGGVLDIKWAEVGETVLVVASLANGQLAVFDVTDPASDWDCRQVMVQDNELCLANDVYTMSDELQVVASDSSGSITLLSAGAGEADVRIKEQWKAHEFAAWTAAFHSTDRNIVYSGGDDCRFKGWDTRQGVQRPTFCLRNHMMGVTCIQPRFDHIVAVGSYDETVCLWDNRQMKRPVCELSVGGGVWRLKWHPTDPETLAVARMHGGFGVVQFSEGELRETLDYNEHESLGYGISWCRSPNLAGKPDLLASCSFYDKALHLWQRQN